MSDQNIILDSHTFNIDTTLLAQYEGGGQELPSKRRIYRHSSNEGSVIVFDYWGTPMKLFVADAKYRAANLAYDTTSQSHGNPQLSIGGFHFNGSAADDWTEPLSYTKDDTWIQTNHDSLRNDGTAKSNTGLLMKFDTTEAAHHCRNQNISGVGQLDLPNLYELIILYLESDNIDALDPTAKANKDKALGKMNAIGRFDFDGAKRVWSSTEYDSAYAWHVRREGYTSLGAGQTVAGGVAPVKELDA